MRIGFWFLKDLMVYVVFKGWNVKINGNLIFYFKMDNKNGFLVYEDDKG